MCLPASVEVVPKIDPVYLCEIPSVYGRGRIPLRDSVLIDLFPPNMQDTSCSMVLADGGVWNIDVGVRPTNLAGVNGQSYFGFSLVSPFDNRKLCNWSIPLAELENRLPFNKSRDITFGLGDDSDNAATDGNLECIVVLRVVRADDGLLARVALYSVHPIASKFPINVEIFP